MSSKRDPTPRPFQSDSRPVFDRRTLLCNGGLVLALQATCSWELRLWNGPADAAEIPVLGSPGCLATSRTAYPPILERFIAKLDPAADEFPAEVYVAEIEKLLAHWGDSICKSPANVMVMESDLAEGLAASSLEPSAILQLR